MSSFYDDRQSRYRALYHGDPEKRSERSIFWTNGFTALPERTYRAFLRFINRSGRILDLGCGNGMLLRFLYEQSPHALEPFGVDFLRESIAEAQKVVLPAFASHFTVANLATVELENSFFDFIIVDPYHIDDGERGMIIERLQRKLRRGGRLIVYSYADSMRVLGLTSIADFSGIQNLSLSATCVILDEIAIAYLEA